MKPELDPENELVQLIVEEVVRAAMTTPLREPILEAVEEERGGSLGLDVVGEADAVEAVDGTEAADGETSVAVDAESTEEADAGGKSRFVKAAQGLTVFAVMFAVLYITLSRFLGDESA